MRSGSPGCQGTFFSITGVVGFLADAITLVTFISGMTGNITLSAPPTTPKIEFGSVRLEWSDVTLMVLIYVGIAFAIASLIPKKYSNANTVFRFHLFIALALLWAMLFTPFGGFQLYLRIASAWLVGLFILIVLHAYDARPRPPMTPREEMEERLGYGKKKTLSEELVPFFTICVVSLLISVPAWAFVEKSTGGLSWGSAFAAALGWGLGGLASVLVVWAIISVVMLLSAFAFSEIFKRSEQ